MRSYIGWSRVAPMQVHCESDLHRISWFGKLPGSVIRCNFHVMQMSLWKREAFSFAVRWRHGGIRYGALSSQRSHSNAYAVLSPLAATLLMAQTQSIIVTCTGFHAFGTRSRVWRWWTKFNTVTSHPLGWKSRERWSTKWPMTASSNADRRRSV